MTTTIALQPRLTPADRERWIETGIARFNRGRFYDCHDAFEVVWRSTTPEPRDLFQGLIQVAVGFVHLDDRGRPDVAVRVWDKGCRRLGPLAPRAAGIDLAALLEEVGHWRSWAAAGGSAQRPALPRIRRRLNPRPSGR